MKKLLKGLRRFKSEYFCSNQDLFEQLARGQNPRVLFITCSDSRVDPAMITQAKLGEIFVIRNAGNLIPPFGATNGGEGASIEYAVQALGIRQIIVCGHSHCGAMKGLLKLEELREELPLVYDWLQHAEATRRLIKEHYSDRTGEELLDITIAENVLTQIENLRTYPIIRAKLYEDELKIYGWIYDIDTSEMMGYDAEEHAYVLPQSQLAPEELDEELLLAASGCALPAYPASTNSNGNGSALVPSATHTPSTVTVEVQVPASQRFPHTRLSPEQAERIYRGSRK